MSGIDLWVARHPAVTVRGICYGRADVPIEGTPAEAAKALDASFPGSARSGLVSSPAARCADVARELAARWQCRATVDDRLCEMSFGAWEGRSWSDIERDDAAESARWMREWQTAAPPGGETVDELTARVVSWLVDVRKGGREISSVGGGASIAPVVVAHAGVMRALLVLLEGESWGAAMAREIPHLAWRRFVA